MGCTLLVCLYNFFAVLQLPRMLERGFAKLEMFNPVSQCGGMRLMSHSKEGIFNLLECFLASRRPVEVSSLCLEEIVSLIPTGF